MNSLRDAAEAVVVGLASTGDADAFEELVRRKQVSVRNLMRYLSRDASIADDLAQRVFLEMWKSLPRLHATAAFSGWLRKIAVNVWLQHARKKDSSLHALTDSLEDFQIETPHEMPHWRCIDLAAALSLLPGPVRLCVVLAYQEGMSHSDIAALTGIALGTIKSHISRGSARLRELLRDYGADHERT
jgi:RNA polymerase sigma-70 factor (ECF subfamily)